MANDVIAKANEEAPDPSRLALERAITGTSQQLRAVIDSIEWATARDRVRLLEDVRARMEATTQMIDRWLESQKA